jgi:outer membrane immunogenic protein
MKKIFLATVATAALASSAMLSGAMAADMAPHAYTKAPAIVSPATNWSGFYAGVNVGYGWDSGNTQMVETLGVIFAPATLNTSGRGVVGGAQIGYNWQTGSLVTGFETDIQGAGLKSSARANFFDIDAGAVVPGEFLSATHQISWFGTARARIGATVTPDLLLYGTGGLAYGGVKNVGDAVLPDDIQGSVNKIKVGWAAGAGAEWMFARNWSAKVEYLYVDLGSDSVVARSTTRPAAGATALDSWKNQENIVRAGVNYHFN